MPAIDVHIPCVPRGCSDCHCSDSINWWAHGRWYTYRQVVSLCTSRSASKVGSVVPTTTERPPDQAVNVPIRQRDHGVLGARLRLNDVMAYVDSATSGTLRGRNGILTVRVLQHAVSAISLSLNDPLLIISRISTCYEALQDAEPFSRIGGPHHLCLYRQDSCSMLSSIVKTEARCPISEQQRHRARQS